MDRWRRCSAWLWTLARGIERPGLRVIEELGCAVAPLMLLALMGLLAGSEGSPSGAERGKDDYPIHIIVKHGTITLLGVVDTESAKTVAGMRARDVPGAFAVENELVVENGGRR